MKFCRTDPRSILSQIKHQEKHLKLKRRWLLGIPASKSERKKLKKILKNRYLSESLLREDDIFYESVRTHVEGAVGAHRVEREIHAPQNDMHVIKTTNIKRLILSSLDNFTTKGLYLLAVVVSGGSVKSEVTRCNLKKIIKISLSSVLSSKNHNHDQLETHVKLFELLTNPQHFRDRCGPLTALRSQSYRAAVANVLRGLRNLSSQTLIAMRRKLKGVKAPIPQLQPHKHGWARDHLIKLVKKISKEMLSQLDRENELQEPLAKAMAVADLSLKLATGCGNIFSKEFYQFSPEVKSLQSDIMNAIWSVKKAVTVSVLRSLQLQIEPEAVISNRCIRTAFVNYLTEFLFECSDMDKIPKSLSQVLDVMNRGSKGSTHNLLFQKNDIEEDVECILSVSAQTKQIVLDLLPDNEFDKDFTDAYTEQLEESDDSDCDKDDDDSQLQEDRQFMDGAFNSMGSNYEVESIGDFVPSEFHPSTSMIEENISSSPLTTGQNSKSSVVSLNGDSDRNVAKIHDFIESDTEIDPRDATNLICEETENMPNYSACKNQYLATQDACDKTSMLAYNLIGHMLEEFAIIEGLDLNLSKSLYLSGDNRNGDMEDSKEKPSSRPHARYSTFVQVVEELIPSIPDRTKAKILDVFMGYKCKVDDPNLCTRFLDTAVAWKD